MDDPAVGLESTVEQLREAVLSLQKRIELLEAKLSDAAIPSSDAGAAGTSTNRKGAVRAGAARKDPYDPIAILSLIGRLLLVLAGGFFLRAMTDSGVIARPVGISLAFVYALVWLFLADRAGGRRQVPGAVFHALAAATIAFPLLVEATTRFKVLNGASSVVLISVLTAGLLFVAWRQRLRAVAWIAVIGALPTAFILLTQTGALAPFTLYLIGFGVATLWFGYALDWWGLRWPVAVAGNVAVVGVTMRVLAPEHPDLPQLAMALQLLLLCAYVGSIVIRTLFHRRDVTAFEIAQTAAALIVGLGGAVYLNGTTGYLSLALGVASLACGVACYGIAATAVDGRERSAPNVYFYSSLALVLVLAGFTLVTPVQWVAVVFALLALVATGLWTRFERPFLLIHGATYLLAAGIASDLLRYGAWAIAAAVTGPWVLPGAAMPFVLVAAALAAVLAARTKHDGDAYASVLRLMIIVLFAWGAGGYLIGLVASMVLGEADRGVDAGVLATVRTGVLALGTLAIAWVGRRPRYREWGWIVYPLLIGIGLKMIGQDFKYSRPATLFIAMALYGAALIVAPRLRRSGEKTAPQSPAESPVESPQA